MSKRAPNADVLPVRRAIGPSTRSSIAPVDASPTSVQPPPGPTTQSDRAMTRRTAVTTLAQLTPVGGWFIDRLARRYAGRDERDGARLLDGGPRAGRTARGGAGRARPRRRR